MSSLVGPHLLAPLFGGRRRILCCHRSVLSGAHAPNSVEAIRECVEQAVPRMEIDVWFLADDAMLVFHDHVLERETSSSGSVEEQTRETANGLRYATGEPVAFLEDVVNEVRRGQTLLQVDLKPMGLLSAGQAALLVRALGPIADRVLVGSQAHWNLRALASAGIPIAFDPTLHWHAAPWAAEASGTPGRLGRHGLWDDAPLAAMAGVDTAGYIASRIDDLLALVPAVEWMVDYQTLLHLDGLGCRLGDVLALRGVELAAWTLKDRGATETAGLARQLFDLGAKTLITDAPLVLAGYLSG
ncbi:MAG: glycerophosphodiester phosphodiesterase [Dehalococcoidia bacterium]